MLMEGERVRKRPLEQEKCEQNVRVEKQAFGMMDGPIGINDS